MSAAATASGASTSAPAASSAAKAKQPKQPKQKQGKQQQTASSNSAASEVDAPFVPHRVVRGLFASSACRCGLRIGRGRRLLVLGDGDLSFSVGLVRHLVGHEHTECQDGEEPEEFDNFTSEGDGRALRAAASAAAEAATSSDAAVDSVFLSAVSSLHLTCSTYEDISLLGARYDESRANAALLRSWGVKVLHGVDARRLHEYDNLRPHATARLLGLPLDEGTIANIVAPSVAPACTFHQIVFHFPHVGGKSRIHLNRGLLTDLLDSARGLLVNEGDAMLTAAASAMDESSSACASSSSASSSLEPETGCIHVSLVRGQGGTPCDTRQRPKYGDHWQVLECASRGGLVLAHAFPFVEALYSGYNSKGFRSRDEEFLERRGVAVTHVLVPGAQAPNADGLSDEVRDQLARDLCNVEHHPLQQVSAFLGQCARSCTESLSIDGLTRQPFVELRNESPLIPMALLPDASADIPSTSIASPASTSASDDTALFAHVNTEPHVPVLTSNDPSLAYRPDLFVHLTSILRASPMSSALVTGPVLEACSHLDSLQWNTRALRSVAADMEAQVPQPIAVQLARQAATSDAASSTTADSTIPLMRGGIAVLHHQLVAQLFSLDANVLHAPEIIQAVLEADMTAAAISTLRSMFGERAAVRIVPCKRHGTLHTTEGFLAARIASEVHLAPDDGLWHAVGRGGCISPNNPCSRGWILEWSLDKLAMLRFGIEDARWLWSKDSRFIDQFVRERRRAITSSAAAAMTREWHQFVPFSLHPLCYVRDNSFWLHPPKPATAAIAASADEPSSPVASTEPATKKQKISHTTSAPTAAFSSPLSAESIASTFLRLAFSICGSSCLASVTITDQFVHPVRGEAMRFRCIYNAVDRALSPDQVLAMQTRLAEAMVRATGVEIR